MKIDLKFWFCRKNKNYLILTSRSHLTRKKKLTATTEIFQLFKPKSRNSKRNEMYSFITN